MAPTHQTDPIDSLLDWATSLPKWQSDALRRIFESGVLTEQDRVEILGQVLGSAGLETGSDPVTSIPIGADHVRAAARAGRAIAIKSIQNPKGVNALEEDQILQFNRSGLTVVLGNNGSGKSGYTRILKRACRSRDARGVILQNVYAPPGPSSPSATIRFVDGNQDVDWTWVDGKPTDARLSRVSVFDSAAARTIVGQPNDAAYTPRELDALRNLADLVRWVADQLKLRERELTKASPTSLATSRLPSESTEVGKLVRTLNAARSTEALEPLGQFDDDEEQELERSIVALAEDPGKAVERLDAQIHRVERFAEQISRIEKDTSDSAIASLVRVIGQFEAARTAADSARAAAFHDAPVKGVGSQAWLLLWEAARAFASDEAHPEIAFPSTSLPDARCVLCQQQLDAQASQRLRAFEAFVVGDLQKRLDERTAELGQGRLKLLGAAPSATAIREGQEIAREHDVAELEDQIVAFLEVGKRRAQTTFEQGWDEGLRTGLPLPTSPLAGLATIAASLRERKAAAQAASDPKGRALLAQRRLELEARKWLHGVMPDVRAEVTRLAQVGLLNSAQREATTNGITKKSNELAEALVTSSLRDAFAREIDQLGMARLRAELRQEGGGSGVPKFRVRFIRNARVPIEDVLSEGEHTCVAFAAFLAEISVSSDASALIFDDPVSSLDQEHREAVAKRLASIAQHRQVIVFTHDLVFALLLQEKAHDTKVEVRLQAVSRSEERIGLAGDPPTFALDPKTAVERISNRIDAAARHHQRGELEDWHHAVKGIAGQMRDLWECVVEKALGRVLKRHGSKVTPSFLPLIAILNDQDCEVVQKGYGQCSEWAHMQSTERGMQLPPPQDLRSELKRLDDWHKDLRQRQQEKGKQLGRA